MSSVALHISGQPYCEFNMDSDAQTDNLPAYYLFQIENFSALKYEVNKFESTIFEAKGCKWKLVLYPNGNQLKEVKHHISVYLELADEVEPAQMVYAVFRLYLLDQINHNDFVLPDTQGGENERCFHQMKLEWGFDRFIHIANFFDPSNGYLDSKGTCVLGAEIVSVQSGRATGRGEFFSISKEAPVPPIPWKIGEFSKKRGTFIRSNVFVVGDHEWRILLYPTGTSYGEGNHLSLYLSLENHIAIKGRIYANVTLCILDQIKDRHVIAKDNFWFDESTTRNGWSRFIPHYHLNRSKDFLLFKDVCFVEAEVRVLGVANAL